MASTPPDHRLPPQAPDRNPHAARSRGLLPGLGSRPRSALGWALALALASFAIMDAPTTLGQSEDPEPTATPASPAPSPRPPTARTPTPPPAPTPTPPTTPTRASLGPFLPPADPVHLPALDFRGGAEACRSWIQIQNTGAEAGRAGLVVWGKSTACAPRCEGPLGMVCTGLLPPGGTWRFDGDALAGGLKSGVVYSFSARRLSAIGVELGPDMLVADYLCAALRAVLAGRCDSYLRFQQAYEAQASYEGLPLSRAFGPSLAVEVLRTCAGDREPARQARSSYAGIAGRDFGGRDRIFDISSYHASLVRHQRDGFEGLLYVQNGGPYCASVELWIQDGDGCRPSRFCRSLSIAPGTSQTVDLAACVAPDWEGSAWLNSSEPLAVAVDVYGHDSLMTYTAAPSELRYSWEGPPEFTAGSPQVFGPLIYGRDRGWDSRLHVQNLSSRHPARVRVTYLDPAGEPLETTAPEWICPYGVRSFAVEATDHQPGPWVGSVRVESLPYGTPGPTPPPGATPAPPGAGPSPAPTYQPNISAVAELTRRRRGGSPDAGPMPLDGALAYNLLPAPLAPDRRRGPEILPQGVALLAIPNLVARSDIPDVTSRLALANHVAEPGRTRLAVFLFDANGLLEGRCLTLEAQEVAYIDLIGWGQVAPSFRGSAVVSALAWEHPVWLDGRLLGDRVGLAAVAVQEAGFAAEDRAEGDAYGATAGLPFRPAGPGPAILAGLAPPPGCGAWARPTPGATAEGGWTVRGRVWLPVLRRGE